MPDPAQLDDLVVAVKTGSQYRQIDDSLVRRLAQQELAKGRSLKEAVRATRSKLHQIGGAYQEAGMDYTRWAVELETLAPSLDDPALRAFCQRLMQRHASTRERLPALADFYTRTLASIGPIHSLLDLACGLNPLALPWLPLAPGSEILACDIYEDLVAFLNRFFNHTGLNGKAEICDLTAACPSRPVQLALLLKTIPCLEQVDKKCGARLLECIQAEHLLVSFPAHSLGGRSKGMPQNYEAHFNELVAGRSWQIERFAFAGESAFLIHR